MNLNVELFGVARQLAGTAGCAVSVGDGATYRDVLAELANRYPRLVGPVIVPETHDLETDLRLVVDGLREVADLDAAPQEGQRLLLMFTDVG